MADGRCGRSKQRVEQSRVGGPGGIDAFFCHSRSPPLAAPHCSNMRGIATVFATILSSAQAAGEFVVLQNAAVSGLRMPAVGLGTGGCK